MAEKISKLIKENKASKTVTKRPSKSQRIHTRRLKQAARDAGTPHR
jgi:hypothetical protein